MTIEFGLTGKRALVTGGGQGVGRGIALTLAEAGTHVVVNDFVLERAEAVVAEIVDAGGSGTPLRFDVTDHADVAAALGSIGPVDILVNNAGNAGPDGFGALAAFHTTDPAEWNRYFSVNLYGVMNCTHVVLPAMIEARWGRVITIVSDAARSGEAMMAPYAAAKAGAAGFVRSIAKEVARFGITANSIALGTMRTPVSAALWDDPGNVAAQKAIMTNYLIRRPGEPADPAWIVATLASPNSSWITGQTIPVNGGYSFAL